MSLGRVRYILNVMLRLGEVIDSSWEWMITVLFRPFNFKKWLLLGFVALMAGHLGGSGRGSFSDRQKRAPRQAQAAVVSASSLFYQTNAQVKTQAPQEIYEKIRNFFFSLTPRKKFVLFSISLLVLVVFIILSWLSARFQFVFLEDLVKNDASIKNPFKSNQPLGRSLFCFNLVFYALSFMLAGLIIFLGILALTNIGVFDKTVHLGFKKIFLTGFPYAMFVLLIVFIAAIIYLIVHDFVVAVMWKDKISIRQAWPKTLSILGAAKADFIKYLFAKLGLAICAAIIFGIFHLVITFALLIPAGIIGAIGYLIYRLIPTGLRWAYWVVLAIIGVPTFLFVIYCLICFDLPVGVFFRTLSLKFFARLEPHYDLFSYVNQEG